MSLCIHGLSCGTRTASRLLPSETGKIDQEIEAGQELGSKRRASFLLPPLVAAGRASVHLTISDAFAKTQATRDFPFLIGGHRIEEAAGLGVQNFRFLRDEQDGPGIEVAAYRAGDIVWARFDITGFKVAPDKSADLDYGLVVLRPDGKVLFSENQAAQQRTAPSFYPPPFIPGVLSVNTTAGLPHGDYTLQLDLRDRAGNQNAVARESSGLSSRARRATTKKDRQAVLFFCTINDDLLQLTDCGSISRDNFVHLIFSMKFEFLQSLFFNLISFCQVTSRFDFFDQPFILRMLLVQERNCSSVESRCALRSSSCVWFSIQESPL